MLLLYNTSDTIYMENHETPIWIMTCGSERKIPKRKNIQQCSTPKTLFLITFPFCWRRLLSIWYIDIYGMYMKPFAQANNTIDRFNEEGQSQAFSLHELWFLSVKLKGEPPNNMPATLF